MCKLCGITRSRTILDVVGQAPWRIKYTQAFVVQRDVLEYMHPDNVYLRSSNGEKWRRNLVLSKKKMKVK